MLAKTARLQALLADGYALRSIESDRGTVDATLKRGEDVVVFSFGADEAVDLLGIPRVRGER